MAVHVCYYDNLVLRVFLIQVSVDLLCIDIMLNRPIQILEVQIHKGVGAKRVSG